MRKVVHFEIPAENLDRAKDFYASIFEWQVHTMPVPGGEYTTVVTTPADEPDPTAHRTGGDQRRHDAARGAHAGTGDHDRRRGASTTPEVIEAAGGRRSRRARRSRHGCLRVLQGF